MKLKSWSSPKVERRSGSSHGLGVFAVAPIKKDEVIAIRIGFIVDEDYIRKHADIIQGSHLQIDENAFFACTNEEERLNTLVGVNHSCEPNVYIQGVRLLTMRDIEQGEELRIDYATAYTSDTAEILSCVCGSKYCRQHIKPSEDWKNPELQRRYKGYFADFIKEKIDKIQRSKEPELSGAAAEQDSNKKQREMAPNESL